MIKDKKDKDRSIDFSKRLFLIRTLAVGIAASASAGLTKMVASSASENISRRRAAYISDELQQERVMSNQQYVLMTDEEKRDMLKEILDNYKKLA